MWKFGKTIMCNFFTKECGNKCINEYILDIFAYLLYLQIIIIIMYVWDLNTKLVTEIIF